MFKQILCLITSAPYYGKSKEHPTGLWLEELAAAYMVFKKAGYEMNFASPAGGPIPIDCNSLRDPFFTAESKEFLHDADAMDMFMHTKKISEIETPGDYDALYMPGGSGCCADFVGNSDVKKAVESTHIAGKVVAIVCHGPIALAECTKPDGTTPFVKGMTVTGFSNAEEEMVGGTSKVPFLIETRFEEQGAKYEKAEAPFGAHICVDGNLVTGQNPASSLPTAEKVVEMLA